MADSANRVVVELVGEIGDLQQKVRQAANDVDRAADKIGESADKATNSVNKLNRQGGAAILNFGRQLSDVGTQLGSGSSPFLIITQQGPQVTDALQQIRESGATLGQVLKGIALPGFIAIIGVLPQLIQLLAGSRDGLQSEIDKLRENAEKSEAASRAKAAFAKTDVGAIDAMRQFTDELRKQNDELKTNAERLNITAKNRLELLRNARSQVADELAAARSQLSGAGGLGEAGRAAQATDAANRVRDLEARLANIDRWIARGQEALVSTQAGLAVEAGKRLADPVAQINRRYDQLIQQAKDHATEQGKVTSELTKQVRALEKQRDAEIKAAQATSARSNANQQFGRGISSSEASAIARRAGFQVNSADRSTARQQQLYDAWVAAGRPSDNPVARPGSSAHERGNALDIQIEPGVTVAAIRKAFADEGVRLTKVFKERGHFHVEWAMSDGQRANAADDREYQRFVDGLEKSTSQFMGDLQNRSTAGLGRDVLGETNRYIDQITKDAELREHAETEVDTHILDEREHRERAMIRDLAGLYEDLFTGGVHGLWDSFKREALRTLAEIAAQETFKLILGGGGGGIAGFLGSIFGGGRASGGPVSAGTLYRVNEAGGPEGFMPSGSGKIIPLGQMNAATRAPITQVHQYFTLDARYGITTPELLQHVNSVAQQQATRAGAVAYGKAVSDTPGRIQQQQTLGN